MKLSIAIDPGLTGAIAACADDRLITAQRMPTQPIFGVKQAKVKREVDAYQLNKVLTSIVESFPGVQAVGVIERVGSRPGQGRASIFSLGDSFGAARGCLVSACGTVVDVKPPEWKGEMGLGHDKDEARSMATRLLANQFKRKKDHDLAEAALLALWMNRR